jgi:transcription antitermination factor NusG
MNKQKLIELIENRIEYYTGGESMKSMNEHFCDERIISELNYIKDELSKPPRNAKKFENDEQVKVLKGPYKNCKGKFKYYNEATYEGQTVTVFVNTPNGDIERLIKPSSYFGKL